MSNINSETMNTNAEVLAKLVPNQWPAPLIRDHV
jgi:hypothetical protein